MLRGSEHCLHKLSLGAGGKCGIVIAYQGLELEWLTMEETKVKALKQAILDLPEGKRQQLAQELLPLLLATPTALKGIDEALQALSDEEVDALVERARGRTGDLPEETIAPVIGEALRAFRTQSRS